MIPTQAQIEAAAVELHKMLGLDYSMRGCSLMAEKALTAAAEIDDTEWTCADCGHKQRGHRFHCEKCGHNFGTVATTKEPQVGDPDATYWYPMANVSMMIKDTERNTIERCAQVAEDNIWIKKERERVGAAIRALKDS